MSAALQNLTFIIFGFVLTFQEVQRLKRLLYDELLVLKCLCSYTQRTTQRTLLYTIILLLVRTFVNAREPCWKSM